MSASSPDSSASPLSGHVVVFTGKLSSLGRKDVRALVTRLGGVTAEDVTAKTTMLVIGAEVVGTAEKSQRLRRAEEFNAARRGEALNSAHADEPNDPLQEAIRILAEDDFCRLAGVPGPEQLRRQYHAVRDLLARYRSVREDHLRYMMKWGIIKPVLRTNADTFFAFQDVSAIKQANDELEEGRSFRAIVRDVLASRSGQLAFDFRIDAAPARILTLQRKTPPASKVEVPWPPQNAALAEEYFKAGSLLDDGSAGTRDQAAAAYRKALELDPYLVAALINLANIHYGQDELVEAQALYERAIGLESEFFEAHFNLGNIYHDLGRFPEAQNCYKEALRLNPFYPDTHFYLAVTLEKMGASAEARPHWKAYQQLAPKGEWVELAKEFSE